MPSLLAKSGVLLRDLFSLRKLQPENWSGYEFFFMRRFFALAVVNELGLLTSDFPWLSLSERARPETAQEFPVGVARLVDLTWLGDPAVYHWVQVVLLGGLVLYVSGFLLPIALPVVTGIHISIFTLANSQGSTHHGHQMGSLVLLAQTLVVLWPWVRKLALRSKALRHLFAMDPSIAIGPDKLRQWLVYHSLSAIAAAYVIAGLAKLINSKGLWLWNSPYIAMGMTKSNEQRYYDYLDTTDRSEGYVAVANFFFEHPFVARAFLGAGFFLELLAFLVLRGRLWALAFGVGLWSMHVLIGRYMGLLFPENEFIVLIFLVNLPFWLVWSARRLRGRSDSLAVG